MLQQTCITISKIADKKLTATEKPKLQKRYRAILTGGEKELPAIPPKPNAKRGNLAKSDTHNLWERIKLYEAAIVLFAKEPHVAFAYNRAEQDLRMDKRSYNPLIVRF